LRRLARPSSPRSCPRDQAPCLPGGSSGTSDTRDRNAQKSPCGFLRRSECESCECEHRTDCHTNGQSNCCAIEKSNSSHGKPNTRTLGQSNKCPLSQSYKTKSPHSMQYKSKRQRTAHLILQRTHTLHGQREASALLFSFAAFTKETML
jgi:hypothetical protein